MNCLFCGTDLGLNILLGDRDFCMPSHRRKYHERLRKGLTLIDEPEVDVTAVTGFCSPRTGTSPCNVEHQMYPIAPVAAQFASRQPVRPWYDSLRPVAPDLPEPEPEAVEEPPASVIEFVVPAPPKQAVSPETKKPGLDLASSLSRIREDLRRKRLHPQALAAC